MKKNREKNKRNDWKDENTNRKFWAKKKFSKTGKHPTDWMRTNERPRAEEMRRIKQVHLSLACLRMKIHSFWRLSTTEIVQLFKSNSHLIDSNNSSVRYHRLSARFNLKQLKIISKLFFCLHLSLALSSTEKKENPEEQIKSFENVFIQRKMHFVCWLSSAPIPSVNYAGKRIWMDFHIIWISPSLPLARPSIRRWTRRKVDSNFICILIRSRLMELLREAKVSGQKSMDILEERWHGKWNNISYWNQENNAFSPTARFQLIFIATFVVFISFRVN